MEARVETRESTRQQIAAKLGLDQPSPFDLVDRSKYPDDETYLNAVVAAKMAQNNPEYQEAQRKIRAEYMAMQEQKRSEDNERVYKEIRSDVKLDSVDVNEINAKAAELAKRDLAAGKIGASDLGTAIVQHAQELTEKRKDTKASNQLFNAMLRGQL